MVTSVLPYWSDELQATLGLRGGYKSPPFDGRNVKVPMVVVNLPQAFVCVAWRGLWSLESWIQIPRHLGRVI